MRFRVQVTIDIEASDLNEAQAVDLRIGHAALTAAGAAATEKPQWRTELTPLDEAARQALTDDGLGPGISSKGSSAGT